MQLGRALNRLAFVFALALALALPAHPQATSVYIDLGTLSSVSNGTSRPVQVRSSSYPRDHSLQGVILSNPSVCTAAWQYSIDGVSWTDLAASIDCSGTDIFSVVLNKPARYVRPQLTGTLTGTSASTVKAAVETLSETNFATHANWDVTAGFVDSGGNAVFSVPETLTETDFATHVNWSTTGDFLDTGGNCAYTHSTGSGTCTQASGGFNISAAGSATYDFSYTIAGVTGDPACNITTAFAATTTALTITNGAQTTVFTSAASPGDFVISCTSGSGGFTIDDVTLKNNTHSATLTQADGNYANAMVATELYTFVYTVSSTTGTPVCQITSGCSAATNLTETDGAQVSECTSSATITDDFVITCTATDILDTTTFDDVGWYQQNAANETPIHIITAAAHNLSTGDKVTITGAVGNTAANVTANPVTVIDADEFTLDATTGNAPWTSGGTITTAPEVKFLYLGIL